MTFSPEVQIGVPLTLPHLHSCEGHGSLPLRVFNTDREDILVSDSEQ